MQDYKRILTMFIFMLSVIKLILTNIMHPYFRDDCGHIFVKTINVSETVLMRNAAQTYAMNPAGV